MSLLQPVSYTHLPNVLVDVDMHPRKYREWGNSLIMYAHGDKEGKRVDKVMQVEACLLYTSNKFNTFVTITFKPYFI